MFETYPSWPIGRSHPQPTAREKEEAQNKLVEDKSNVQGIHIRLVLCQPAAITGQRSTILRPIGDVTENMPKII